MPPLSINMALQKSAQQHAEEMAGNSSTGVGASFSHDGAMERFTRSGQKYDFVFFGFFLAQLVF